MLRRTLVLAATLALFSIGHAAKSTKVSGRVIAVQRDGDRMLVTINRGSNHNISNGTPGFLINAEGKPLAGSDFHISRVDAKTSVAPVALGYDAVKLSPRVILVVTAQ